MKKQVTTQQAQNACQTAWMFGLQNNDKKKIWIWFLLYYDVDEKQTDSTRKTNTSVYRFWSVAEDIHSRNLAYDKRKIADMVL